MLHDATCLSRFRQARGLNRASGRHRQAPAGTAVLRVLEYTCYLTPHSTASTLHSACRGSWLRSTCTLGKLAEGSKMKPFQLFQTVQASQDFALAKAFVSAGMLVDTCLSTSGTENSRNHSASASGAADSFVPRLRFPNSALHETQKTCRTGAVDPHVSKSQTVPDLSRIWELGGSC